MDFHANTVALDGLPMNMAQTRNGSTIYVTLRDANDEEAPDRGLVAIVDISISDCERHMTEALDGCATCAEDDLTHEVVLAHLPNYDASDFVEPFDDATLPRMRDADEATDDDASIDNDTLRVYRPVGQRPARRHPVHSRAPAWQKDRRGRAVSRVCRAQTVRRDPQGRQVPPVHRVSPARMVRMVQTASRARPEKSISTRSISLAQAGSTVSHTRLSHPAICLENWPSAASVLRFPTGGLDRAGRSCC